MNDLNKFAICKRGGTSLPNRADILQHLDGTTDGLTVHDRIGNLSEPVYCQRPALQFDGVGDRIVSVDDYDYASYDGNITFRWKGIPATLTLTHHQKLVGLAIDPWSANNAGDAIVCGTDGVIRYYHIAEDGTRFSASISTSNFTQGEVLDIVAGVRNGNEAFIEINGISATTSVTSPGIFLSIENYRKITIGATPLGGYAYEGIVVEASVDGEQQLPIEESAEDIVYDVSGNGNHGQLISTSGIATMRAARVDGIPSHNALYGGTAVGEKGIPVFSDAAQYQNSSASTTIGTSDFNISFNFDFTDYHTIPPTYLDLWARNTSNSAYLRLRFRENGSIRFLAENTAGGYTEVYVLDDSAKVFGKTDVVFQITRVGDGLYSKCIAEGELVYEGTGSLVPDSDFDSGTFRLYQRAGFDPLYLKAVEIQVAGVQKQYIDANHLTSDGTKYEDLSGNGNMFDATGVWAPEIVSGYRFIPALPFKSRAVATFNAGEFVEIIPPREVFTEGKMFMDFWLKWDGSTIAHYGRTVWCYINGGNGFFRIQRTANSTAFVVWCYGDYAAGVQIISQIGVNIPSGQWHRLTVDADGETCRVYLDGVLAGSSAVNKDAFVEPVFDTHTIGDSAVTTGYSGDIRDFNNNNIQFLKLDEGSGTDILDSSGNGNDTTFVGDASTLWSHRIEDDSGILVDAENYLPIENQPGKVMNGAPIKVKQTDPRILDGVWVRGGYLSRYGTSNGKSHYNGQDYEVTWDGSQWGIISKSSGNSVEQAVDTAFPPKTGWPDLDGGAVAIEYDSFWVEDGEFQERSYDEWMARTNIDQQQLDRRKQLGPADVCHVKEAVVHSQSVDYTDVDFRKKAARWVGTDCGGA